ncbi:MAG: cation diffusion facilitator family transporter [Gammaproteobacteria bacterium]|nr:cation diffusion facilitator family transporter [Gammaproteobacteria bacterium]
MATNTAATPDLGLGDPSRREIERLMKRATYASVATALILIIAKLYAWFATDSVSILASLIDSSLDALASMVNLLAVRHALAPADHEHRFGHGKLESLSGLAQSTFITGSAGFLLLEAFARLMNPQPVKVVSLGIAVMVLSIVMTFLLLLLQRHTIRKTASTAIKADYLHYSMDLLVNGSVVVALLLAAGGWAGFDAVFAVCIVVFILHSAWGIAKESLEHLLDRELPDEDRARIEAIVRSYPGVCGMHDLRTRRAGRDVFIQLHLELPDNLTLVQAHAIADGVEVRIIEVYPDAEVIVHEDPISAMEVSEG